MAAAPPLDALPPVLRDGVAGHWAEFTGAAPELAGALPGPVLDTLPRVWAASEFAALTCRRHPEFLEELLAAGALGPSEPARDYPALLAPALVAAGEPAALHRALRRFRNREMLRIAWRDIAGWADLERTVGDLSALAEACIRGALDWLHPRLCAEYGTPRDSAGRPQRLLVLGMGKLGAGELNFSSDVDLVFAYPEEGETDRGLSNAEFFTRQGRALIEALGRVTADGFVFRVDMRLRPFGDAGALVASFGALESYYETHGREWERYALIKARPVAGDPADGERLMALLQPFVYRRYIDYSAFESLREMKALIEHEVARKGLADDIKLGPGGIREVEFIAQAFQLIRGGAEPALRARALLTVLARLQARGDLPDYVADELAGAYVFLRTVEHRLQEYADQQTHRLPGDETGRARLALGLGFPRWEAAAAALEEHRGRVHRHFQQVFAAPQAEAGDDDLAALWQGALDEEAARERLAAAGYRDPGEALRRLGLLREARATAGLTPRARARLDALVPLLLGAAARQDEPDAALTRALDVIEAVGRRSVYLSLLVENPMALSQLVRLCGASPWIAGHLARHPAMLDELLDPRTLYAPPDRAQLAAELAGRLAAVPADDEERVLDVLRQFRHANVLRVAAADIAGVLPLRRVSDHLTWIAEVILERVENLAWCHLTARHGPPPCAGPDGHGFAVVGYGKLGGRELGYGSDLDLVFLHAGEDPNAETRGGHPVPVSVFFARLGQRIIHILTARTAAGTLYEVDVRLRPDGAAGMLVSSLGAFARYQQEKAWTWEHQALVRARPVAGDPVLAGRFGEVRRAVLGRRRDPARLRREVREMREKMRRANSRSRPGEFDLKQDRGGIADIEFMVQYGVLAWAADHPELLAHTDNLRILEGFARAGLVGAEDAAFLAEAYQSYRDRLHRLTLQERPAVVPHAEVADTAGRVAALWRAWLEDGPGADETTGEGVRK